MTMLLQLLNIVGMLTWTKMVATEAENLNFTPIQSAKIKRIQDIQAVFNDFKGHRSVCDAVFGTNSDTQSTLTEMIRTQSSASLPAFNALRGILTVTNPTGYHAVLESFLSVQPTLITAGLINKTEANKLWWWNVSKSANGSVKALKTITDQSATKWWRSILIPDSGRNNSSATVHLQKFCSGSDQKLIVLLSHTIPGGATIYATVSLDQVDMDQCDNSSQLAFRGSHNCDHNQTKCVFTSGYGFKEGGYQCCCNGAPERCYNASLKPDCSRPAVDSDEQMGTVLMVVNLICIVFCLVLILVVINQRKVKNVGTRGWALMELLICGAIFLYGIVVLEFLEPVLSTCLVIVWFRELGFSMFYGAVVLKIYRNLIEFRVRQAHHVFVKEKDLFKYMCVIEAFTLSGLVAWTLTRVQYETVAEGFEEGKHRLTLTSTPSVELKSCSLYWWSFLWHVYEVLFLLYGLYLCNKAKNTVWWEKKQFTASVVLELVVTIIGNLARYCLWTQSTRGQLLLVTFFHVHFSVTVSLLIIIIPKFRSVGDAHSRSLSLMGGSKAHPSLAKLRDGLANGTLDFAQVPIAEMDPEDIKAELKRVYTQLRMFKIKSLYEENPHVNKKKGGKKSTSSKQSNRRLSGFSVPSLAGGKPKESRSRFEEEALSATRVSEEEEGGSLCSTADFTVQSSPHNLYIACKTATAASGSQKKLQLDSDRCYRI